MHWAIWHPTQEEHLRRIFIFAPNGWMNLCNKGTVMNNLSSENSLRRAKNVCEKKMLSVVCSHWLKQKDAMFEITSRRLWKFRCSSTSRCGGTRFSGSVSLPTVPFSNVSFHVSIVLEHCSRHLGNFIFGVQPFLQLDIFTFTRKILNSFK